MGKSTTRIIKDQVIPELRGENGGINIDNITCPKEIKVVLDKVNEEIDFNIGDRVIAILRENVITIISGSNIIGYLDFNSNTKLYKCLKHGRSYIGSITNITDKPKDLVEITLLLSDNR